MHWCPRCQKHVPALSTESVRDEPEGKRVRVTRYRCRKCGAALGLDRKEEAKEAAREE